MPMYEYKFLDGDEEVVLVEQSMRDDRLSEIDGRPVVKLISAPKIAVRGDDVPSGGISRDRFRQIYEKNVAEAEPVRQLASKMGVDYSSDEGAVVPED